MEREQPRAVESWGTLSQRGAGKQQGKLTGTKYKITIVLTSSSVITGTNETSSYNQQLSDILIELY